MNRTVFTFWKSGGLRNNWRVKMKITPPMNETNDECQCQLFVIRIRISSNENSATPAAAALLFWGWQSGLPWVGAAMGIILESAWLVKVRWDFSDADFRRILTFCTLFAFAATLYVFTASQEAGGGFQGAADTVGHAMSISSLKTSTTFFQWLPMFLFLFVAAQTFSTREKIPLTAISIISRWRSRQDQKRGDAPAGRSVNVSYPYFIVCLFSAGIHANEGGASFFWGQCALIFWALWRFRSRRFGIAVWALALAGVLAFGYLGQCGIGELQQFNGGYLSKLLAHFMRQWTDPMQSMTAIGQIGELKLSGQIVIRLRTKNGEPPPVYLREASYRAYNSQKQSWHAGSPRSEFGQRHRFTRNRPDDVDPAAGKNQHGIRQHRLLPLRRESAAATAVRQRAARKSERLRPSPQQRRRGAGGRSGTRDFRRALRTRQDD